MFHFFSFFHVIQTIFPLYFPLRFDDFFVLRISSSLTHATLFYFQMLPFIPRFQKCLFPFRLALMHLSPNHYYRSEGSWAAIIVEMQSSLDESYFLCLSKNPVMEPSGRRISSQQPDHCLPLQRFLTCLLDPGSRLRVRGIEESGSSPFPVKTPFSQNRTRVIVEVELFVQLFEKLFGCSPIIRTADSTQSEIGHCSTSTLPAVQCGVCKRCARGQKRPFVEQIVERLCTVERMDSFYLKG